MAEEAFSGSDSDTEIVREHNEDGVSPGFSISIGDLSRGDQFEREEQELRGEDCPVCKEINDFPPFILGYFSFLLLLLL